MDRRTDRQTYRQTDRMTYGAACTRLKIIGQTDPIVRIDLKSQHSSGPRHDFESHPLHHVDGGRLS